jgi:hypothetical protein
VGPRGIPDAVVKRKIPSPCVRHITLKKSSSHGTVSDINDKSDNSLKYSL